MQRDPGAYSNDKHVYANFAWRAIRIWDIEKTDTDHFFQLRSIIDLTFHIVDQDGRLLEFYEITICNEIRLHTETTVKVTITWNACFERAKLTRNIFFAKITTAIKKNIQSFSRKKLTALNVKFLQSLGFVVYNINIWIKIFEMVDILNIGGEPIFDALSSSSFTRTIRTLTRRLDIATRSGYPYNSKIYTRYQQHSLRRLKGR